MQVLHCQIILHSFLWSEPVQQC